MNRDIVALREVITKLVPMIAGKGLAVTQRGSQAFVEYDMKTRKPKRVNIPNVPDNATSEFISAIQGFIDHECGHVLITDWDWIGGYKLKPGDQTKTETKRVMELQNIIEDTMIETGMIKRFPGAKKNLGEMRRHFITKITQPAFEKSNSPQETFRYLLMPIIRALANHREFQEYMDEKKHWELPIVKEFMSKLPASLKDRLPHLKSTRETFEAAKELDAILFPKIDPPIIEAVEPNQGSSAGGDYVAIIGKNFIDLKQVLIGGNLAQVISHDSAKKVIAVTPAHVAGLVDVGVVTNHGSAVGASLFEYVDPQQQPQPDQNNQEESDDKEPSEDENQESQESDEKDQEKSEEDSDDDTSDEGSKDDAADDDGESEKEEDEDGESQEDEAGSEDESDDPGVSDTDADEQDEPDDERSDDENEDNSGEGDPDQDADDADTSPEGEDADNDDEQDGDQDQNGSKSDDEQEVDEDENEKPSGDKGNASEGAEDSDADADNDGEESDEEQDSQESGEADAADGDPEEEGDENSGDEGDDQSGNVAIQTDDHEAGEVKSPEDDKESGGGVGNGVSKSMFEFDDDHFDGVDTSKQISILIQNEVVDALGDNDYNVYSREFDRIEPLEINGEIGDDWISKLDDETRAMTGKMSKDIERMMAAKSRVFKVPGYRSGRLHAPNLHRLVTHDDRVFNRREEYKSKDTAVSLVIDNSGSMKYKKIETAMVAGYALATTLERVGIANEVVGFTTGNWEGEGSQKYQREMNDEVRQAFQKGYQYHRIIPIVMPIYKAFDERINSTVKKRIAWMANAQKGMNGNVDGESIEYAAIRLMKRKEQRKVMLVLSDGQPSGGANVAPHLKQTVEKLEKIGIDMVGIGIMDASVQRFYKKSIVLRNVADLPNQVMDELKKILAK